jgi:solute carrier family 27 (fatty acid transporter), member 1/4
LINKLINIFPNHIIKVDDNKEPIRDENGFCIKCEPNENGLMVGIIDDKVPKLEFNGYANNKSDTDKKIIYDLFKKGQRAYNTGDLMVCDQYGWIYFVDRIGDTFRWRGENVSCTEVENIISSHLDSLEVCVYGVEVKGQEGRAGMVAISKLDVDVNKLGLDMKRSLPPYAVPLFIRLCEHIDHTGTFKAQKKNLVYQNFDIDLITNNDSVYYFDKKKDSFIKLNREMYEQIQQGLVQF